MSERVKWVDLAKGLSIILVVIYHSTLSSEVSSALYSESIGFLNDIFNRIRMPLFFFVSGLFIKKAMLIDTRSFYKFKAIHLLYLYVLWSIIRYITSTVPEVFILGGSKSELYSILNIFITPPSTLWFIYALFVFIVFTRLTKSIPYLILAASIILFLTKSQLGIHGFLGEKVLAFYPFYLVGYLASDITRRTFQSYKFYYPFIVIAYFASLILTLDTEFGQSRIGILVFSLFGIIAGILIALTLSKLTFFSWIGYIGKNTLPIYLMHFFPVNILRIILPKLIPDLPFLAHIITVIIGVLFPIVIMLIARKTNANWLFEVPSQFIKLPFKKRTMERV